MADIKKAKLTMTCVMVYEIDLKHYPEGTTIEQALKLDEDILTLM